jgi:molybdopterin converting factor small subunit
MKITLKLFATLSAHLPPERRRAGLEELELDPGTTVGALIAQRGLPRPLCTMILLNGMFLAVDELDRRELAEGDVLAIWPPVGGG